jgi:hypothetical protein
MPVAILLDPGKPTLFDAGEAGLDLPHFLCPVCLENLIDGGGVKAVLCDHVLFLQDEDRRLFCRDGKMERLAVSAWKEAERRGLPVLDVAQEHLGPDVVFFDVLLPGPDRAASEVVTLVIDLADGQPVRAAA